MTLIETNVSYRGRRRISPIILALRLKNQVRQGAPREPPKIHRIFGEPLPQVEGDDVLSVRQGRNRGTLGVLKALLSGAQVALGESAV